MLGIREGNGMKTYADYLAETSVNTHSMSETIVDHMELTCAPFPTSQKNRAAKTLTILFGPPFAKAVKSPSPLTNSLPPVFLQSGCKLIHHA